MDPMRVSYNRLSIHLMLLDRYFDRARLFTEIRTKTYPGGKCRKKRRVPNYRTLSRVHSSAWFAPQPVAARRRLPRSSKPAPRATTAFDARFLPERRGLSS